MLMSIKIVRIEEKDEKNEIITDIAWNSNNLNDFFKRLKDNGIDEKIINMVKLWGL